MKHSKLIFSPILENNLIDTACLDIPNYGTLCQSDTGYVYLKVLDDFIHTLFPLVDIPGKQMPPYFSKPTDVGAHISVIYREEYQENILVKDTGKRVCFKTEGLYRASLNTKNYIVLIIKAVELEHFRIQHGFSAKPVYQGFEVEFHITIATY